eukprot:gnl/MRDRNA2_/MRDRNA2_90866_c0_seq1.p1 gnl/MRDRNA2_/MRDRNA2_90866_c0~~gnl/MRDRNA2_/MRDRNA2_90866_c0_seq1.p1  ORF type:complete len:371 (+),score=46.18 gnl/MRDRNA2_/MRDRNA2_90866_c0_seq1:83-1195(+)
MSPICEGSGLHVLCTAPLKVNYLTEFTALKASVSELSLDGTITEPREFYDAIFISFEAHLALKSTKGAIPALYDVVAELVETRKAGWVHLCAAGLDVPFFFRVMRACHTTGTRLTHSPGVSGEAISEYVLAHMLSVCRELPEHARNQAERKWMVLPQRSLRGQTLSVIGAGGIGMETARLAKAFGMRVLGMRRNASPQEHFDEMLQAPEALPRLLAEADFLLVSCPLTPATRGLIGSAELKLLKPTCWLMNVSRGQLIDEAALIEALQNGNGPAGAVIDTPSQEPLPSESPLWTLPNVVLTPHDSFRTNHSATDNHRYFLNNLGRYARGEDLLGIVDQEKMEPALSDEKLKTAISLSPKGGYPQMIAKKS